MEVLPVGDRAFRRDPLAVAHCSENAADRVVRMARARDRLPRLTSPLGVPRVGSGKIPERPVGLHKAPTVAGLVAQAGRVADGADLSWRRACGQPRAGRGRLWDGDDVVRRVVLYGRVFECQGTAAGRRENRVRPADIRLRKGHRVRVSDGLASADDVWDCGFTRWPRGLSAGPRRTQLRTHRARICGDSPVASRGTTSSTTSRSPG